MSKQDVKVKQGGTERTDSGPVRTPVVDIYETESGLTVVAEMPGVEPDAVAVEVEKGVLTISGQVKPPQPDGYNPLYEGINPSGNFFRAFALSDEIDRDATTATLKDGVLTVVLPKAPEARSRKIKVEPGP